jgi:hypothetical protein
MRMWKITLEAIIVVFLAFLFYVFVFWSGPMPALVREYRCDIVAGTGTFREWQQGALVIDVPLSAVEFNSICMRERVMTDKQREQWNDFVDGLCGDNKAAAGYIRNLQAALDAYAEKPPTDEIERLQATQAHLLVTIADLRGSGRIEEDAYTVAFLHHDEAHDDLSKPRPTKLVLVKNRGGPPGVVDLLYWQERTLHVQPTHRSVDVSGVYRG